MLGLLLGLVLGCCWVVDRFVGRVVGRVVVKGFIGFYWGVPKPEPGAPGCGMHVHANIS